jgi:chromosome partitioning protein
VATILRERTVVDRGQVRLLAERCSSVLEKLREGARNQRAGERREPVFPIGRAAELVGRTPAAIRDAEKDGRLPAPPRGDNNRRVGYTLAQLNDMRGVFGTRPWRNPETDPCAVVAVQNFKGGVGKSTISVHLAQFLAIKGYRVLLIDCDSQASATTLFGYVPDLDLQEEDTLYTYLREDERTSLEYAIRSTHFDGLDLIPANLRLFQSEYEIAARMARGQGALLDRLSTGIASVAERYDAVVIDPPPALGAISLSVLRAANSLVVPVPPTVMDFSSTAAFMAMLDETMEVLEGHGMAPELNFLRFVASKVDDGKSMQKELLSLMQQLYGLSLVRTPLKDSAEIDNATARLMTVYELDGPMTSRSVRERCLTYLDGVNSEIEIDIRSMWPSHAARLRKEGLA